MYEVKGNTWNMRSFDFAFDWECFRASLMKTLQPIYGAVYLPGANEGMHLNTKVHFSKRMNFHLDLRLVSFERFRWRMKLHDDLLPNETQDSFLLLFWTKNNVVLQPYLEIEVFFRDVHSKFQTKFLFFITTLAAAVALCAAPLLTDGWVCIFPSLVSQHVMH